MRLSVRVYGTNFHSTVSISRIIPLLGGARGGFFLPLTKILCGYIRLIPVTHPYTPPEEGNFEQEHEVCVCWFPFFYPYIQAVINAQWLLGSKKNQRINSSPLSG